MNKSRLALWADSWHASSMNDSAYDAAARIILRRPHTVRELTEKLRKKNFSAEAIEEAISTLKEHHYLDDTKLAKQFVEWHINYKPMGRCALRFTMIKKGFQASDIESALERLTSDVEKSLVKRLVEQRTAKGNVARDKLARFLLSRGFDNETVLTSLEVSSDQTSDQPSHTDF
jgi:regulatory protein